MGENPSADQIDAILADPDWLPYRVLDECKTLKLIHLRREKLSDLSFIDSRAQSVHWRTVSGAAPRATLAVADLLDRARGAPRESCHFIFHSAFCCSTLMSRALDVQGVACVLREPRSLYDLGEMKRASTPSEDKRAALYLVLELMKRPRLPGERTIIKPANNANPLIDHIMEDQPNSRALLMYASLPDFILAIARGRRWSWARTFAAFYRDHLEFETPATADLVYLTDLQMAAFLWLQQQAQFARLSRNLPEGKVATLRADVFVERPMEAIVAAAALFALPLGEKEAAEITAGPIFRNHSKRPGESFEQSTRKRDEALVKLAFSREIEQAIGWAEAVAADASIPMELNAPLVS